MRPVVFHLADRQMEEGIRAFFRRPDWWHKLGCASFDIDADFDQDIFRNPLHKDSQVLLEAHNNLQVYKKSHAHAIVVLDEYFGGTPGADAIRARICGNIAQSGWPPDSFEVIVIQPMLEAWLWTDSQHVEKAFGYHGPPSLRDRMRDDGLWPADAHKPTELKKATKTVASWGGRTSDSALFRKAFGSSRSIQGCQERGFLLLRGTLQRWFPKDPA